MRSSTQKELPKVRLTIMPAPQKPRMIITSIYMSEKTNQDFYKAMKKYKMTKEQLLKNLLKQII